MKSCFRFFMLLAVCFVPPSLSHAQTYVSDYDFSFYAGSFSSIASTGTRLTAVEDDDVAVAVTLPFAFPFGQETCTQVMVSSNGQIGIGTANPSLSGFQVHDADMSIISPLAYDYSLNPDDGHGTVYYEAFGSAPNRYMVIEFHQVSPYSDTTSHFTFQAVLNENGDIEFVYDSCVVNSTLSAYVFLHEQQASRTLALSGPWTSPFATRAVSALAINAANNPSAGLTFTFTRPDATDCLRPINFECVSTARTDSIVFAWTPASSTAAWELRWDTVGTPVDSMRNAFPSVTDTFYVCSTMVAGGVYEAYLRTDCGSDYSFWEGPVRLTPGSYNMTATGSHTIYACGGVIYDDGGLTGTYSPNCNSVLTILPTHPDSIVTISGTLHTQANYDILYVYDGSTTSGTLLYRGSGLNQTVPQIRSIQGPLTLQFVSNASTNFNGFALNVACQRAPLCRYISAADIDHVAGASAYFSWEVIGVAPDPSHYVVTLVNQDEPTAAPFVDTTSQHFYFFSGLSPVTNYRAAVCSICGTDTIPGDTVTFQTRCLAGGESVVSGNGTSLTTGVPVNSGWGNTFCQSIFTAAELTAMGLTAGPIRGITYNWNSGGSYEKELTVFMGHTTNTTFTSYAPLTGSMTQVYSGTRPTSHVGKTEYQFNTPFIWDGVSNIVLSSFVNQPTGASHTSSGFYAYSTNAGVTRTIYAYRDNTPYVISGISSGAGNTSTSSFRPNVTFIMSCDSVVTCVAPNLFVDEVKPDTVSLRWASGYNETSWDVDYRATSDTGWINAVSSTSLTSLIIGGLTPQTEYIFRVTPECQDGEAAALAEVTTLCVPVSTLPFTENFENFTANSSTGSPITQCWQRGSNYPSSVTYPYLYSMGHSGTHSMYFYSTTSYYSYLALPAMAAAIDSLQISFAVNHNNANYSIRVGVMTDPDDFSTFTSLAEVTPTVLNDWQMFEVPLTNYTGTGKYIALACSDATSYLYVDDIEVNYQPNCPRPTNLSYSGISTANATVHWTDSAAGYFEIEYGPVGFTHGTGTLVTSSTDSVNLYGLHHSTSYDVYVRGICSGIDTSNWSFVTSFNTLCSIIDSLPYSQNFANWGTGAGARPLCWAMGGYSNFPYIVGIEGGFGQTVGHVLNMYTYNSNYTYASMPELDSISYPINLVQTVFRAWADNTNSSYYSHQLVVGLCTVQGDLATFSAIDTFQITANPTLYEVAFDTALGLGKYVTFVSVVRPSTSAGTTVYYNSLYLDSISLELIPDCQAPNRLVGTALSGTTATLSWNERNTPLATQLEYGPHGFVLGTGTRVNVSASPYAASGLAPSTSYQFYVRSVCGVGDTSEWSLTPGTFTTLQNPATLPYFYDFEAGEEWNNWQTCSNTTINWYRDTAAGNGTNGFDATGRYSMFVSTDTGATYSTRNTEVVNATAYRDIDFGTRDSSYLLTFRAKAGGTPSAGYDGLMVFLVDPNVEVVPSSINLTTPWGNVNDMTYLTFVRVSTNWNTYSAILDTLTGVHRLAFYWFNQNTSSDNFVGGPAAVDDISIDYIACPRPAGVRATQISMASAQVVWHGPSDGDYRVTCRNASGDVVASELVHTNSITLSNLTPSTLYRVYVRRLCSPTDSSQLSVAGTFTTLICNSGQVDTIGNLNNATTSIYLPISTAYSYSYTQQIVTADELSGSGEISAISFYYSYATALSSRTSCTISMGHTSLSSFASANDVIDPANLQVVYNGAFNFVQGWNRIILDNPFVYNGASNIVIAIDDNSGHALSSAYIFSVAQTPTTTSLAYYSNTQNPDASSLSALAGYTDASSLFAYRPLMVLETCPQNPCSLPIVRNPIIRSSGVTLRWRHTGEAYQVSYRRAATSSWVVDNYYTEDTVFDIPSVYPNTDYVYRIRKYCDSSSLSNWYVGTFNSNDIPCLSPTGFEVTELTNRKAAFNWVPEENNTGYRLHVFNSYYDRVINRYGHTGVVNDLDANVTYYAAVQATCQDFTDPSEWSDTISFTTDVCPDVTNLTYSNLQGNSVVLDWTEGGRAQQWEVLYGFAGFTEGNGFSVIADHHPFTLTGLTGETEYDIYVRAICDANFTSEHWSNKVTIETPYSSISGISDDSRLQLFPNPANASVTLSLTSVAGRAVVSLMDLKGRVIREFSLGDAASQSSLQIDLSDLSAGSYFVRVTGDNINTVRKLMVR